MQTNVSQFKLTRAAREDHEEICRLYQTAIEVMRAGGLDQWTWGEYPAADILADDIEKGQLYIARDGGRIVCAVCINCEQDGEYAALNWHYGVKPGLFHRLVIAPDCQGRGFGRAALDEVCCILREMGCDALRCDTYSHNTAALRLYDRFGMRRPEEFRFPWKADPFVPFEKAITADCPLLPIRMMPAYRAGDKTPWGGDRLKMIYGKDIPCVPAGEALEVSCILGLESRDATGVTLPELIARHGCRLTGRYGAADFPLLLKLLDARETLSVQVHPDDAYAAAHEGKTGKTEAWLILQADEGAELVYGLHEGVTIEQLREACETGDAVEGLLRRVPVKPGDVCFIPAGCVHAICKGVLLYEIQQSSDVTYRFYDWNRRDAQGNLRPLHVEDALAVTRLDIVPEVLHAAGEGRRRMLDTEYFKLDVYNVNGAEDIAPYDDFAILTALTGGLVLRYGEAEISLRAGETYLLPAAAPEMTLVGEGQAAVSLP